MIPSYRRAEVTAPAMRPISVIILWLALNTAQGAELQVTVAPRVSVVERDGITGAGQIVMAGDARSHRAFVFYPNHPDDFGGSGGTGASRSDDGGVTWQRARDDWPLPRMIDLWADRLRDGELLAFGLGWVPDPKRRGELSAEDVPADAYRIARSRDQGRHWAAETAVVACPPELGIIARPLPHIFEGEDGNLLMPAYAWSRHGNSALLLHSADRGGHWTVMSTITTAAAMVKAGAPVTTPWLETTISPTRDKSLLAIIRTGSGATSTLMVARSADHGQSWSPPTRLVAGPQERPIAGKLPTLQLLPNGLLVLLTAHSKNHCRLYISPDGTGRRWSDGYILTSQCGGNAGMTMSGAGSLLVVTPANGRIDAWAVRIGPMPASAPNLGAPRDIALSKGTLTWTSSPEAASHQITPVLIKSPPSHAEMESHPHATIQTRDPNPNLDLNRQLVPGGTYVFEVATVDKKGRVSPAVSGVAAVNGND